MFGVKRIAALGAVLVGAVALILVISGGGDSEPASEVPGGADPESVQVVVDWAQALSQGDEEAAASYFAIPSFAQNGLSFHISTATEALKFNESLPCAAVVEEAVDEGRYIIVTFRLGEKINSNACGDGAGETARTAFLIEGGKIIEWRRVANEPEGPRAPSSST
jgi:hypothetical protein